LWLSLLNAVVFVSWMGNQRITQAFMEEYIELISAYTFATSAVPFSEAEGGVLMEGYKAFEQFKMARQQEGLRPFGFVLPERLLPSVNAMTARLQCTVDKLLCAVVAPLPRCGWDEQNWR